MRDSGPSTPEDQLQGNTSPSTDKEAFFNRLYSLEVLVEKESESRDRDNPIATFLRDYRRTHQSQIEAEERLEEKDLAGQQAAPSSQSRSRSRVGSRKLKAVENKDRTLPQRVSVSPPSPMPPERSNPAPASSVALKPQRSTPSTRQNVQKPPPKPSTPSTRQNVEKSTPKRSTPSTSEKPSSKRKRKEKPVPMQPEHLQLFKGLIFYFVPNNPATSGARRFRITKAIEFGATSSTDFENDDITHIIVDRNIKYSHLLRQLKTDSIPEHIAVVTENYPPDCLTYHRILDVTQPIYEVPGRPSVPKAAQAVESSPGVEDEEAGSNRSLQIKPVIEKVTRIEETQRSVVSEVTSTSIDENRSKKAAAGRTKPDESSAKSKEYDTNDILDQIIKEAKKVADLPLDDEEESEAIDDNASSDDEERYDSDRANKKRKIERKTSQLAGFQATFQCMYKHDGEGKNQNPNERTIQVLSEMQKYYEMIGDHWRSLSYRKAITTLKKQTTKIVFAEEAHRLPFIGERIAKKIEEIVFTNHLKRLEYAKMEPNDVILKLFLGVYGAGTAQAQRWIAAGYKSLDDLLKKAKLTQNQRIGVEHYDDFNTRIPREEVQRHGGLVTKAALEFDPQLQLDIMGSFRRGAKDCGDIDMIITKRGATAAELKGILDALVKKLFAVDFLQCTLATSHKDDSGSKWHGASKIQPGGRWRRIDFLLVPWKERGAALLYFTGNDIFNRSMRLLASKKGYRLNQRGLYKDVMRGPNRVKVTEGTLVEGESEEKIFEILGVPYRPPEHRIC